METKLFQIMNFGGVGADEHAGIQMVDGYDRYEFSQIKFVKEAFRISKKYVFITTPNRYFPLDLHTAIPIIHWLPKKIHRIILRMIGHKFLSQEKNLNLLKSRQNRQILFFS